MFPAKYSLERELNVQVATSALMDDAISRWLLMYKDGPQMDDKETGHKTLRLPSAISEEFSRLVLTEFEFSLEGSPRADFLNEQLDGLRSKLYKEVEMWCALGGIVLKPYVSGDMDKIMIDYVHANRFYPTAFNSSGDVTGAVLVETKRIGDYLYTRLEHHDLQGTHLTVVNKAYKSERIYTAQSEEDELIANNPFSEEVSLETITEWASLSPIVEMDNIDHPLFVYIRTPRANTTDPSSPLGASVYARAESVIRDVDEQYGRLMWEFEATEAAVDADEDLFATDRAGRPILPEGRERLYRTYTADGSTNSGFLKEYAPTIRDASILNGLNEILRKVEFLCGLAYGTLSNPNDVDRTAEEIKGSKQRSYVVVNNMQTAWDQGLDELIEVMEILCDLYNIVPEGEVNKSCTWGDGILEDAEKEYQRRWSMVMANKMKVEKFYSWYFGCTEEEAAEYIPEEKTFPEME